MYFRGGKASFHWANDLFVAAFSLIGEKSILKLIILYSAEGNRLNKTWKSAALKFHIVSNKHTNTLALSFSIILTWILHGSVKIRTYGKTSCEIKKVNSNKLRCSSYRHSIIFWSSRYATVFKVNISFMLISEMKTKMMLLLSLNIHWNNYSGM